MKPHLVLERKAVHSSNNILNVLVICFIVLVFKRNIINTWKQWVMKCNEREKNILRLII